MPRGILCALILFFLFYFLIGDIGPEEWNWLKITILLTMSIALFIVLTVPDHFLEEHLWEHIVLEHVPRIFLWTLGALFVLHILIEQIGLNGMGSESNWFLMAIAALIGLIPESGPHVFFITSYAKGLIPISILLVSSVIQDGHGLLPMLAYSRRDFLLIKMIKFIIGLGLGYGLLLLGY